MSVIGSLAGGADRVIGGIIALQDNATGVLQSIRQEQSRFRQDIAQTRLRLRDTFNQRYRTQVETTPAVRAIGRVVERLRPLRQRVVTTLAVADLATAPIRAATRRVQALGSELSRVGGQLKNLAKGVAIPIAIAGGVGAAALGATVSSGMQLEQQQVAMAHFIQATNKDWTGEQVQAETSSYIQKLRDNANATPFETGEVIAAGSRAVAISGGDTYSAMRMIELAEDMAAASGGTASVSDAIEALADAKMGEMERLKSFGFKVSAEEFKQKGFEGVQADLQDFFGGAANKLATTGSGLVSTITGKLKSYAADFGLKVVEEIKPALGEVITLVDKAAPAVERFGTVIAGGIGRGVKAATAILPKLSEGAAAIGRRLEAAKPVICGVFNALSTAAKTLAPVFGTVFDGISQKVGAVLNFVGSKMGWLQKIISKTAPVIASVIKTAWNVISPVLDIAGSAFKVLFNVTSRVFEGIVDVVSAVWGRLEPIIQKVAGGLEWVSDKVSKLTGGNAASVNIGGKSGKVKRDSNAEDNISAPKLSRPKIGRNAKGDDNWRGGLTWVGEEGPELVELPGGSRILPNRESVAAAAAMTAQASPAPIIQTIQTEQPKISLEPVIKPSFTVIEGGLGGVSAAKPDYAPVIPTAANKPTEGAYAGLLGVMDRRLANMESRAQRTETAAMPPFTSPVPTQTAQLEQPKINLEPVISPERPAINLQPVIRPELTVIEGGLGGMSAEKSGAAPIMQAAANKPTEGAYAGLLGVMDKRLANMESRAQRTETAMPPSSAPAAVSQSVQTEQPKINLEPVIRPERPKINLQPIIKPNFMVIEGGLGGASAAKPDYAPVIPTAANKPTEGAYAGLLGVMDRRLANMESRAQRTETVMQPYPAPAAVSQSVQSEQPKISLEPVIRPELTVIEGGLGGVSAAKPDYAPVIPTAANKPTEGAYAGLLGVMDRRLANMESRAQRTETVMQPYPAPAAVSQSVQSEQPKISLEPVIRPERPKINLQPVIKQERPAISLQPVIEPGQEQQPLPLPKGDAKAEPAFAPAPNASQSNQGGGRNNNNWKIELNIAKLADKIEVRSDEDIDAVGEAVVKKVLLALKNAPGIA